MSIFNPEVNVSLNLLHTVAESIYADTAIKIKEAVSNSMDNNASKFLIYFDKKNKRLSLIDNGSGISNNYLTKVLKNIGYGLEKNDNNKLSYYGLGLMSVIRLGQRVTLYSKTTTQKKILKALFNSKEIFNKKNENKSINFLSNCITIDVVNDKTRQEN
ncbi:ATP-binding protein, partial [Candidatus Latescibacterota bacterium]